MSLQNSCLLEPIKLIWKSGLHRCNQAVNKWSNWIGGSCNPVTGILVSGGNSGYGHNQREDGLVKTEAR